MNNMKTKQKNVVFVGGETAGPIMPLLALAEAWVKLDNSVNPFFLDLKHSVAARVVPNRGYKFKKIVSGKLRRYWSIKNLFSPLLTVVGFIQAILFLIKVKPVIVVGAGGYVQVPVILAAWILKIPRLIHQQDVVVTFSNKICAPFSNKITTTFEKSVKDFREGLGFEKNYGHYTKTQWTGNPSNLNPLPVSESERNIALNTFKLDHNWPTVLVIGGGSGARGLNTAVVHSLPELLKVAQVIHSTGAGKSLNPSVDIEHGHDRYHQYEFIDQIEKAYTAADIVISRAGIGAITSLSILGKPSIIVPMPDSHQELNAQYLYDMNAAIILDEKDLTPETFAKAVRKILFDADLQTEMQKNIKAIIPNDATTKILNIIQEQLKK